MTPLLLSAVVLVYGIVLSKFIPTRIHWLSNSLFSAILLLFTLQYGLDASELGISLNYAPKGVLIALVTSLVLITCALALASLPVLHKYFLSQHSILKTKTSRIVYETTFRIPLVTALFEEFVFRGVVLAMFASHYSITVSIIYSSIVFGLWHISPAINGMNENHYKSSLSRRPLLHYGFVTTNIVATSLVGLVFGWLRIISGSIFAPWILHWTINAGGVVAVLFANKQSKKSLH